MTRAEHMEWCKSRALEYVADGQLQMAVASMLSDLKKHPETEAVAEMMGGMALFEAANGDRRSIRKFIEGFR